MELSPIIAAAPILPCVPFFAVVAADFFPRDTPASYLQKEKMGRTTNPEETATKPPVLVCVGDSLTHGSVSANWVSSLSRRLGKKKNGDADDDDSREDCTVLNAGRNGETAAAVRARLGEIVAVRPRAVALLVGTNDLIGSLDPSGAGAFFTSMVPAQTKAPTLGGYAEELEAIVRELDARLEEWDGKIAVLSPPPLGEGGPTGPAWKQGKRMATICSDICGKASNRVSYIPLYDMVRDEMVDVLVAPPLPRPEGQQQQGVGKPSFRRGEFSFKEAWPLTIVGPWKVLLRQPFDKIRKANGYRYTTDSIHFGNEFADIVEEAVASWVTTSR